MIARDVYDNGLCLLTESMPDVRSVSLGVWLTRGSRHEGGAAAGMAHFAEHMVFKGTTTRTAEDIAQAVDSMGGQLDAFTAKECTSYYVKVLDEHLPRAVDLLADLLLRPAFRADDIDREKKVILEEIKMVEDMPTISSTSCSRAASGPIIRSGGRSSVRRPRSAASPAPRCGPSSSGPTRPATWSSRSPAISSTQRSGT